MSDGRVAPQPDWREWNQEAKLTGRHGWQAFGREHPLQGGYEYRNEKLQRGSLSVSDPSRDINVLWGQQELNLTSRLTVTAGLRYDNYSDFGDEWSPKAEAVFTLAPEHRLRGSYGHGFRPPYFGELYLSTPPFFVGNPDLVPEVSDGFTAGYTFAGKKAQLSVDGYYTKVKNGIIFFQLTPSQFTYRNIDRYDSKGVNVAASVSLPWWLHAVGRLLLQQAREPRGRRGRGLPEPLRLPEAPLGQSRASACARTSADRSTARCRRVSTGPTSPPTTCGRPRSASASPAWARTA